MWVVVVAALAASCSHEGDKMENIHLFPNQVWNRFEPVNITFSISAPQKPYDVWVELSVMDGFEVDRVPFEMVMTSPDGQENIINKVFVIKNKEGQHIGSVYGDAWTVRQALYSGKEFLQAGEYTVTIQNRTQYYELFKVASLRFGIAPSKKIK
jgi:hypothetical protein